MTTPLVQRLSLVVDAATGNTESRMDAVASASREMGTAAERSAGQVAAAAERVAAAQGKRDDAADRVALAERKLSEASQRYAKDSSQVLAAEQRLERERRGLHTATRQLDAATEDSARAQDQAARSANRLAEEQEDVRDGAGRLGEQLGDLAKIGGAFLVGDYLRGAPAAFLNGARGAATLAASMNATVEEGGRLSQLFTNLGLESDDLLEIQAEFATKVGTNGEALAEFGAEMKRNRDGTTNWALTLESALIQLQKIPDATVRNATGFRLFGEEGYKQLSRLVTSGVSVEDALARIGTPFDQEDVEKAQRFDAALSELQLTGTTLQQNIGGALLPILSTVGDVLNTASDAAGAIPGPIALATGGTLLYAAAARSAAVEGTLMNTVLSGTRGAASRFTGAVGAATAGTGALARGMGVARVAGSGLLTAVGGPLGAAVIGLGVGFTLLNSLTGDNSERAEAAARANEDLAAALQESGGVITRNVREQAAASAQQAGILEMTKAAGVAQGDVTAALLGNEDAYQRVTAALEAYDQAALDRASGNTEDASFVATMEATKGAREELDRLRGTTEENATAQSELSRELQSTADLEALATAATDALTTALEDGNVATDELARLAGEAAKAQDAAAAADNRAAAAVDAYRARTSGAVEATLDLISAQYGAESAGFAFLQAMDAARGATDDASTSVNEQREAHVRLMQAALSAAGAAADAAVQNAEAAGTVVDDVTEAQLRANAMLADLRGRLNTPGLTKGAREEMQGLITQLEDAQERGDITAVLSLTGADQVAGDLDDTTEDRDTTVRVESRNGPAVDRYLDGLASQRRLALIHSESRGGPAVDSYLDRVAGARRLSLIHAESRGGPAVDRYLDSLTRERLAIIRVETRGGPAVDDYLDSLAARRTAVIDVQRTGGTGGAFGGLFGASAAGMMGAAPISIGQLVVQPQVDGGGRLSTGAQQVTGRQVVGAIREYERQNGTAWRRTP